MTASLDRRKTETKLPNHFSSMLMVECRQSRFVLIAALDCWFYVLVRLRVIVSLKVPQVYEDTAKRPESRRIYRQ